MSNTTFKKLGLLLETSTDPAWLILTEGETPLAHFCIEEKESYSRFLVMHLTQFLAYEQCSLSALKFIAAGQGPGSYTSLRVGATVAKSLAFALKIPLIGFCSLEIYTPPAEGNFLSAMDANTRGLYLLQGQKRGSNISFFDKPALISHEKAPLVFENTPQRLIPKNDPLSQKFPSFSFIESVPDFHQIAKIVAQKLPQEPQNSPYPELDLLYL